MSAERAISLASRRSQPPGFETKSMAGWGNYPVEKCDVYRPERLAELSEIVARAPQPSLIARGLGRAYGDATLNLGGAIVAAERLDRMLAFDEQTGTLHCEAAVSLSDILDAFVPRGFFFPVTPGTKYITIGGAIAADVHGKNHHHDGSISAFLESFRLLLASGEIAECSKEHNSELFWATVGGMGLTGIVLDAHLRLKPIDNAWVSVDYRQVPDLDAAIESFRENDHKYAYTVAWIDALSRGRSLGRCVLMHANHARDEELPPHARRRPNGMHEPFGGLLSVPFTLPNWTLNNLSMRAFNEVYYRIHPTRHVVTDCNTFFYPLDAVGHWNRAFGRRGVLQYQVMIPYETAREGLVEILEEIYSTGNPGFVSVLKSFGEGSQGFLSFPRPGFTLTFDLPNTGPALRDVINRCDAIVMRHGGRVYLAKDARLAADSLPEMYPGLARFREIKAAVDPEQRFSSSLARRLRIVEPE